MAKWLRFPSTAAWREYERRRLPNIPRVHCGRRIVWDPVAVQAALEQLETAVTR